MRRSHRLSALLGRRSSRVSRRGGRCEDGFRRTQFEEREERREEEREGGILLLHLIGAQDSRALSSRPSGSPYSSSWSSCTCRKLWRCIEGTRKGEGGMRGNEGEWGLSPDTAGRLLLHRADR